MPFCKDMITPRQQDIARITEVPYKGGRNIIVYSYTNNGQASYLSHVYRLNPHQDGQEFIYDPQGRAVAQFPLRKGKAHGRGKVAYTPDKLEEQYFYRGEVFPHTYNAEIIFSNGASPVIEICADMVPFEKKKLKKAKLPDYIFKKKENIMTQTVIFEPVAQNTVIRPMAEAICIVRGGDTIDYVDTATHEKKSIIFNDLSYLDVRKQDGDKWVNASAYQVALEARKIPTQVRVDVNDISVLITPETTLVQAMAQFKRKITVHNREMMQSSVPSRQYE